MNKFNPSSKHPARALQAWQILIGAAKNRQTLTYELLSMMMYQKKAAGVLASVLGHIAYYCIDNKLPALTSIVVMKGDGIPGIKIPVKKSDMDAERENVYQVDWYDIYPPSEAELSAALENHK